MILERLVAPLFDTNTYLLAADTGCPAVIVDPGHGHLDEIHSLLASYNLSVGAVLCTHGHPDHTWDAAKIANDAPVWIGQPDEKWMDNPLAGDHPIIELIQTQTAWDYEKPSNIKPLGSHAITYSKELVDGVTIKMVMAPGHTEGSAFFLWEGNVTSGNYAKVVGEHHLFAFTGDILFAGSVGRTDLPFGDSRAMLHSLRTLCNVIDPDTFLLPGHGPATTMGTEKRTNPYLKQARYQG
ncbi:MAG: MBL fold metallo-hydrolase [Actinomycetaceae bacterium]|nr:MBL fold metallo-hydrolase [Actinomycetaceae bacterium]